ncbi:MAG: succinate dehydrogenase/fumarate reductase iron-sulfur subunit [Rhizobacter sp.]|nr:succinate dehydrogenase/fumarate reductase iron-sulfur subunit [Burkholderiales bacterium]
MPPLKVRIWRGAREGAFVSYEVPRLASQSVLDVVTYVQRSLDPSLSYRFSCRVGMCGSCAMSVNGVARWTCRTHVSKVTSDAADDVLELAPLSNLPIIKDLTTDMSEFFDKWARAKGQFTGTLTRNDEFSNVKPDSPERKKVDAAIECIGCGVCYASCDTVTWRPDYLGPAALNRAWSLVNDVRDAAQNDRLKSVAGDAGCHACHTHTTCSERCPKGLEPTAGISGLKRLTARAAIRGELD